MKAKVIHYKGLYGDDLHPALLDFIHLESLEVRSKLYNWEIHQHIHSDLYQIFVIISGGGSLNAGSDHYDLTASNVILIPPHLMHGFHFKSDTKGYVLTISQDFIESRMKSFPPGHGLDIIAWFNPNRLSNYSFKHQDHEFKELLFIIQKIQNELEELHPQKRIAVQSYFQLLFVLLMRMETIHQDSGAKENQRVLIYFKSFHQLIRKSIHHTKPISDYANELKITTVHLNRICKKLVNKSALEVVHEYLILECKKYLLNTSYSISQISYLFNFKDPAYFTRMFKRMTGVTPKEFRK